LSAVEELHANDEDQLVLRLATLEEKKI